MWSKTPDYKAIESVDRTIVILEAVAIFYNKLEDAGHLGQLFRQVGKWFPLARETLRTIHKCVSGSRFSEETYGPMKRLLEESERNAQHLESIFQAIAPPPDTSRNTRYHAAVRSLGRRNQVEVLMKELLQDIRILAEDSAIRGETRYQVERLHVAIDELSAVPLSVPEEEPSPIVSHFGISGQINIVGAQNINTGGRMQYNAEAMFFGKN